jgi:hypothetical protein
VEQPSHLVAPQTGPAFEGGEVADYPEDLPGRQAPLEQSSPNANIHRSGMPPSKSDELEQTLPLEAVWPVQAIPVKQAVQKAASQENSTTNFPEPLDEDALLTRRDGVETILQSIAPADQTSSRVELITPRRMPPVQALRKPAEPAKTNSSKEEESRIEPSKSRKPDIESQTGEPSPAVIPTEIGSLPSDLWELIDEPRPEVSMRIDKNKPEPETSGGMDSEYQFSKNQANSIQERTDKSTVEPSQVRNQPKTAVVQRQETGPTPETPTSASSPSPTGPADSQVEELARRIYNEVRKKLRIDWERFRN